MDLRARAAEKRAGEQAAAARTAEKLARDNEAAAVAAHERIQEQLAIIKDKEAARLAAEAQAETSEGRAIKSEADLARKNRELELALARAEDAWRKLDERLQHERTQRENAEEKLKGATRRNQL